MSAKSPAFNNSVAIICIQRATQSFGCSNCCLLICIFWRWTNANECFIRFILCSAERSHEHTLRHQLVVLELKRILLLLFNIQIVWSTDWASTNWRGKEIAYAFLHYFYLLYATSAKAIHLPFYMVCTLEALYITISVPHHRSFSLTPSLSLSMRRTTTIYDS